MRAPTRFTGTRNCYVNLDILVLDEPMQGLDIQSEAELYDYVRSLPAKYGEAVPWFHDLQWVMQGTHRGVFE